MAVSMFSGRIIDGDGHIFEDIPAILSRMPSDLTQAPLVKAAGPFPQLDNLHTGAYRTPPGSFVDPGVEGWTDFIDATGLAGSIVYPTAGLGFCRLVDVDLAVGLAQAYNEWLHDTYMTGDPRIKGMALIPMQDPEAAAQELRRAVVELGMAGAMIPPTGLGSPLGSKEYWPVYEVAHQLRCALGVHGGAHQELGLDRLAVFAGTHALGHPFALSSQFVDMLYAGLFDRFPNARFGFMEGGVAWFLLVMERCPGSYDSFVPVNRSGRYLNLNGESLDDYIIRQVKDGRLYVGVEGDEPALDYAVQKYGNEAFIFSSDFPHEVNQDSIKHEIEELEENPSLTDDDKAAIFFGNAQRFYGAAFGSR